MLSDWMKDLVHIHATSEEPSLDVSTQIGLKQEDGKRHAGQDLAALRWPADPPSVRSEQAWTEPETGSSTLGPQGKTPALLSSTGGKSRQKVENTGDFSDTANQPDQINLRGMKNTVPLAGTDNQSDPQKRSGTLKAATERLGS